VMAWLKDVAEYMSGLSYSDYRSDKKTIAATLWCISQISENAGKLSDDLKSRHPEIPWINIAGFRNRIIHDYGSVDYLVVYQTLTIDVPKIASMLEKEKL
jgi:uncharacterized protein with HEPN domain